MAARGRESSSAVAKRRWIAIFADSEEGNPMPKRLARDGNPMFDAEKLRRTWAPGVLERKFTE
jgi:hypothetical protein